MPEEKNQKVTIPLLQDKKKQKEKIVAVTAYDFPVAKIVDECGIDLILVGDSLGMVVLGYENTIPVTMEEMIHHAKPVGRASKRALVVGDMPYFSFHLSIEESVVNASRFLKEAGTKAVKIEGASKKRLKLIEALIDAEIPVMGHVGLTPQSIHHFGQFKVKGKEVDEAERIITDAINLEEAGVFSVVLECIPMEVARIITEKLKIPTIGIGAGPYCDGQILVFHDLVGFSNGYLPKFVKRYADLHELISGAVKDYIDDVKGGKFPEDKYSYHLNEKEAAELAKKEAETLGKKKKRGK
ncbi:MAG: 3-methyl-2-oxobutanoate hydroxymethyltransferase [Candidatus Aminicenantes bacterium]|nr:MAG: 3-methyl-2-oxobutanoate hydroxymethyltransferase [Candidatus Aminicenantes bacterium]